MAEKFKVLIEYGVRGKSGHWGHQSQPGHKGGSLPKDGQMAIQFPKRMKKTTTTSASVDKLLQRVKDKIIAFGVQAWEQTKETEQSVPIAELPSEMWKLGKEHGYLFNPDGSASQGISGTHNQIDIPDEWDFTDKVFLHTHPSSAHMEYTTPFSYTDIFTCISRQTAVIAISSDKGTVLLARKEPSPNPIDKHWGVTPQGLSDAYNKVHVDHIQDFRNLRDTFLAEARKKGPVTPRMEHDLTMVATHTTNYKVFSDLATKFGWTMMYLPEKGYKVPAGFKDVNPWRIK